jgi:site-specific recombinase XerD
MGENMNALRDAAGHARLSTTEHYTHLADEQTFNAVNHITKAICE